MTNASAPVLTLSESVTIAAAPDKVWRIIGHFDSLAKWHPGGASSVADKGDEIGSRRKVVLAAPGDPVLVEQLLAHDDAKREYSYAIREVDLNVLPVTDYTSMISVEDDGAGGSRVIWKGSFQRGDHSANPPEKMNDAAARAGVKGIYRGGLDNLKILAEKK